MRSKRHAPRDSELRKIFDQIAGKLVLKEKAEDRSTICRGDWSLHEDRRPVVAAVVAARALREALRIKLKEFWIGFERFALSRRGAAQDEISLKVVARDFLNEKGVPFFLDLFVNIRRVVVVARLIFLIIKSQRRAGRVLKGIPIVGVPKFVNHDARVDDSDVRQGA